MITCFRAVGPYRSDQNGLSGEVGIAPDTFTALMSAALATENIPSVKAIINAFINLLCLTVLPPLLADPLVGIKKDFIRFFQFGDPAFRGGYLIPAPALYSLNRYVSNSIFLFRSRQDALPVVRRRAPQR